nr:hypothetical protein [Xanthomonas campestris]
MLAQLCKGDIVIQGRGWMACGKRLQSRLGICVTARQQIQSRGAELHSCKLRDIAWQSGDHRFGTHHLTCFDQSVAQLAGKLRIGRIFCQVGSKFIDRRHRHIHETQTIMPGRKT